jgi:hypothetical protein
MNSAFRESAFRLARPSPASRPAEIDQTDLPVGQISCANRLVTAAHAQILRD